jgi:hypothetical protein
MVLYALVAVIFGSLRALSAKQQPPQSGRNFPFCCQGFRQFPAADRAVVGQCFTVLEQIQGIFNVTVPAVKSFNFSIGNTIGHVNLLIV